MRIQRNALSVSLIVLGVAGVLQTPCFALEYCPRTHALTITNLEGKGTGTATIEVDTCSGKIDKVLVDRAEEKACDAAHAHLFAAQNRFLNQCPGKSADAPQPYPVRMDIPPSAECTSQIISENCIPSEDLLSRGFQKRMTVTAFIGESLGCCHKIDPPIQPSSGR